MDPNCNRQLRARRHRRAPDDIDSKTSLGLGIPDRVGLQMQCKEDETAMRNQCTYPVPNTDIRVFFCVVCPTPALIQRLRHREPKVSHWLLRIRHTQEEVLIVRSAARPHIRSIQNFDCGSRL